MEPYWNEVRIDQVIGRALSIVIHKDLPMGRNVKLVYVAYLVWIRRR
jgi:hypothetical protein